MLILIELWRFFLIYYIERYFINHFSHFKSLPSLIQRVHKFCVTVYKFLATFLATFIGSFIVPMLL